MLAFIWAEDNNHIIGNKGTLPWHLPDDMSYLKKTTLNTTILMGRRTFESFPKGALPHRRNIVLTHQKDYSAPNIEVVHSKNEALKLIENDRNIFIFGGNEVFKLFIDDVEYLYVTKIDHEFEGDVKMVNIDYSQYKLIKTVSGTVDQSNLWKHEFNIYRKK